MGWIELPLLAAEEAEAEKAETKMEQLMKDMEAAAGHCLLMFVACKI